MEKSAVVTGARRWGPRLKEHPGRLPASPRQSWTSSTTGNSRRERCKAATECPPSGTACSKITGMSFT